MKQMKTTVIVLLIWIFVSVLTVISTSRINWTKYRYEDITDGITCSSSEHLFFRNGVSDEMECSKICFIHSKCLTSVYQPGTFRCTGCDRKGFKAPLANALGSIQLTRRDFFIDCKDVLAKNKDARRGIYEITLLNSEVINVYCDMTTDGGGWTRIQSRNLGIRTSFNKSFEAYEDGFGNLTGDFWLGLRYIQKLTDLPSEMRYYITTRNYITESHTFGGFKLFGEDYLLYFDEDIKSNSMHRAFNSSQFFTYDKDSMHACATRSGGGWWYPLANTSADSNTCYIDDEYN